MCTMLSEQWRSKGRNPFEEYKYLAMQGDQKDGNFGVKGKQDQKYTMQILHLSS